MMLSQQGRQRNRWQVTHSRASWWRPMRSSRRARVSRKSFASMGTRSSTFLASRWALLVIYAAPQPFSVCARELIPKVKEEDMHSPSHSVYRK